MLFYYYSELISLKYGPVVTTAGQRIIFVVYDVGVEQAQKRIQTSGAFLLMFSMCAFTRDPGRLENALPRPRLRLAPTIIIFCCPSLATGQTPPNVTVTTGTRAKRLVRR